MCRLITKHRYNTREEWLAIRAQLGELRLGGSEIGTAVGVNEYKSPYRLWAEKKGLVQPKDISQKGAVRQGTDLEEYVVSRFCEATGKKVQRENSIMTNEEAPHLFASIDRRVLNEESGLECKTVSPYRVTEFDNGEFPKSYYAQCLAYLKVTGLKRWYLAALIFSTDRDLRIFCMTTVREDLDTPPVWCDGVYYVDESELQAVEDRAAEFCELLKGDVPPAMTGIDCESDDVLAVHPTSQTVPAKEMDEELNVLLFQRKTIKDSIAELERQVEAIDNRVREFIGDAELATSSSWKVSWKSSTSRRLDTKRVVAELKPSDDFYRVSETRTLRFTQIKNK